MITESIFGKLADGRIVHQYTITNSRGEYVELLDYGATIHGLFVLDKNQQLGDVVLGSANIEQLSQGGVLEGATIGRIANRIEHGRYMADGQCIQLELNDRGQFLHSCSANYAKRIFDVSTIPEKNQVIFLLSDDGRGGFGCGAEVSVSFSFDDNSALSISYEMTPDGTTVLCPTNHAYFNLACGGDSKNHILKVEGSKIAEKDEFGIPHGSSLRVEGTPYDFCEWRTVGDAIKSDTSGLLGNRKILDDYYLLDKGKEFGLAAQLICRETGRLMRVYTDMPAVILYTPNLLQPKIGKYSYEGYCAVCIETQFVPNAVNCVEFDSPLFHAGEKLISRTVYSFEQLSNKEAFD
ncbi:MAG: aldose epimerase family protein [Oscillospiraceae bacterium]